MRVHGKVKHDMSHAFPSSNDSASGATKAPPACSIGLRTYLRLVMQSMVSFWGIRE